MEAVTALKNEPGDSAISLSGSVSIVRQLLAAGLLDELHLLVHPIAVGRGLRLFDEADAAIPLELVSSETFATGVLNLVYRPAAGPATPATTTPRPTCPSPTRPGRCVRGTARTAARDPETVDAEHAPGVWLSGQGRVVEPVPGGGDEQRRPVGAAERARRGPIDGEGHGGQQRAVGSVPADGTAVPQRDPDPAVLVDGEAVGCDPGLVDGDDRAAPADVPAERVEVEGIDPAGPAVGEVHGGAVGAPADAVGDGQAGQHGRAAAVQLQPVERARPGRLVVGHRAGPEATRGVAGAVVHPHVGAPGLRLGQLADRAGVVDVQEAGAGGEHVPAARGRRDRPDVPVERDGLHRLQRAVGAGPAPVQGARRGCRPTAARRVRRASAAPRVSSPAVAEHGTGAGGLRRHGCANSMTTLMSSGVLARASSTSSGRTRRVTSCSSQDRSALASTFAAR